MRIALFTPYLPAPATTGGRIRTHHLVDAVRVTADIALYAVAAPRELGSEEVEQSLGRFTSRYVRRPWPVRWPTGWPGSRLPRRVARGVPFGAARAFAREHRHRPFDAVWVEHAHAAKVALSTSLPIIVDEHNIESAYLRSKREATGARGDHPEVEAMARWERGLWQRAREVVCVTAADAEVVARAGNRRDRSPHVIANGVDLSRIVLRLPSSRRGGTVLFVGLMNHPPNEIAATFLVQQVMPKVWLSQPDTRLVLCGANPSAKVQALTGVRVTVTGTVPSVRPFLDAASVFALPLFHGAGSSLKVLEALAAGIPLVSTEVGVRGFPLERDVHYAAAETAEAFAAEITRALDTDPHADVRAQRGREVAEGYQWQGLGQRFADIVRGVVHEVRA